MHIFTSLLLLSVLLPDVGQANLPAASQPVGPQRIGTITYPPIKETSGLARCRSNPELFWVLNDSGNPPVLYLVDRVGRCLAEYGIDGAGNVDWEALASDGQGRLYVGDIGNNTVRGGLPLRLVYQVPEPDVAPLPGPTATQPARRTLPVQAVITYSFPDVRFDAEAMFCRQGRLYVVSKVRTGRTGLWEVALDGPGIARPVRQVCSLPKVHTVTDASLSPDGRRLALCSYEYTAIFPLDPAEPLENLQHRQPLIVGHVPPLKPPTSIEACCWIGPATLLLGAEGGPLYQLAVPAASSPSAGRALAPTP